MDQGLSAPGIAMLLVLAICFVALVLLAVTWPGVKNCLRRERHTHAPAVRHRTA